MTFHKYIFLAIGMIAVIHSLAFSQVTIRDTIILNSGRQKTAAAGRTLGVNFFWSGGLETDNWCDPKDPSVSNMLELTNTQCYLYQDTKVDNGSGSVSIPNATSGTYNIVPFLWTTSSGTGSCYIYLMVI